MTVVVGVLVAGTVVVFIGVLATVVVGTVVAFTVVVVVETVVAFAGVVATVVAGTFDELFAPEKDIDAYLCGAIARRTASSMKLK